MKDISQAAPDLDKVMNGLYKNALGGWLGDLKSMPSAPNGLVILLLHGILV